MFVSMNSAASGSSIVSERARVYGDPLDTFPRIAQAWSGIIGHDVSALHVALCMMAIKMVRAAEVPDYSDNSDDIAGYLEVFRELVGPDMVHATSVDEYVAQKISAARLG